MARRVEPERDGSKIILYGVVDYQGNLKVRRVKRGVHWSVYGSLGWAKRGCTEDGDSVVRVYIDLSQEPLFILKEVK